MKSARYGLKIQEILLSVFVTFILLSKPDRREQGKAQVHGNWDLEQSKRQAQVRATKIPGEAMLVAEVKRQWKSLERAGGRGRKPHHSHSEQGRES